MTNNIIYDTVIRLRFDQFIWNTDEYIDGFKSNSNGILYSDENIECAKNTSNTLKIDKPANDEIYLFGCGIRHNYVYVNDQFWIHNSSMIEHMKNFYDSLPSIINSCKNAYPHFGCPIEHFFALYVKDKKIMRSNISGAFIRLNNK
jgi:hypothetical protein